MITVAICDDEKKSRDIIIKYLERYTKETGEEFKTTIFNNGEELVTNYPYDVQIILMDIYMDELNGIDAIRKIRAFDKEACVIFITTMSQYAIECYKVRAFGFLPKPVSYIEFKEELRDAIRKAEAYTDKYIILKSGTEVFKIEYGSILYAEAQNHNIIIHTDNTTLHFYKSMKELEQELNSDNGFFRCHVAYLVNHRHIKHIGKNELLLSDGECLPISKYKRNQFLSEVAGYVGAHI